MCRNGSTSSPDPRHRGAAATLTDRCRPSGSDTEVSLQSGLLDVRRLRFLVELSHRGTIAAVAEALHMSPSGISHQLALLEREAGAALLERVGRGVRLTEAGRRLAERGADILAALELAQTEVRSGEEPRPAPAEWRPSAARRGLWFRRCWTASGSTRGCASSWSSPNRRWRSPPCSAASSTWSSARSTRAALASCPATSTARCSAPTRSKSWWPRRCWRTRPGQGGGNLPWALEPVGAASRAWAVQHCLGLGFTPTVQYESCDLELLLSAGPSGRRGEHPAPAGAAAATGDRDAHPHSTRRGPGPWSRWCGGPEQNDPSVRAVRAALRGRFRIGSLSD